MTLAEMPFYDWRRSWRSCKPNAMCWPLSAAKAANLFLKGHLTLSLRSTIWGWRQSSQYPLSWRTLKYLLVSQGAAHSTGGGDNPVKSWGYDAEAAGKTCRKWGQWPLDECHMRGIPSSSCTSNRRILRRESWGPPSCSWITPILFCTGQTPSWSGTTGAAKKAFSIYWG